MICLMISAFFSLSACAPKSNMITAKEVPAKQYEQLECTQLEVELEETTFELQEASTKQNNKADSDILFAVLGLALFPLWFILLAEDEPYQVAELKGQKQALDDSIVTKNC